MTATTPAHSKKKLIIYYIGRIVSNLQSQEAITYLRYCMVMMVILSLSSLAKAQDFIDPSKADPTYDLKKMQGILNRIQPSNPGVTTNGITNGDAGCFIPRDSSYIAVPRNDDGSVGPVSLPFSYNLYGTNYTQVYINNNGNITFTGASSSFTATGFPTNLPMVAGFWADIDTRSGGQVYYKVSPTRLIVTWDGVGYYSGHTDKLNTFQIILTNGSDSTVGIGNNTGFYYKDMQWTTGDSNDGISGFGGTPATVGINKGNSVNYVQIGRFNINSSIYDGPGGNNDGINYLDNRCFTFNAVTASNNLPPSVSGLPTTNPVTVNVGDTVQLNPQFIGPEVNQMVTTIVNTRNLCRVSHIDTNGIVSKINLTFIADTCNAGSDTITFTATDNGNPAQSTVINYVINVNKLNQTITFPALSNLRYGIPPFALNAVASSGLPITYVVTGPASVSGNTLTITGVGTISVTATQPGSRAFNPATSVLRSICALPSLPSPIVGDTIVCSNAEKQYTVANVTGASFTWTISGGGTIGAIGNTATARWSSVPGLYTISVKYNGNCGVSDSTRTMTVRVDNELVGTIGNMLPTNGNSNIMLPLTFSWSAINGALSYDLYIWPSTSSQPSTPTVSDINALNYTIIDSAILHYRTNYNWRVIAKRNCYSIPSPIQNFTLQYSPDLVADSIGVPSIGFAGRTIKTSWKVKNIGKRITTISTWTDRVYVSASPVYSPGSALAQYDFVHTGNLLSDSSYIQTQEIQIPQNISGTYYIHVFTDINKQLNEYNQGGEDNNSSISNAFQVNLKMPADLVVSQLVVPIKAGAGQKTNINWTVKNQGDSAIGISSWHDKIYLSLSPVFNVNTAILVAAYTHSGGLTANSEYNNSVLVTVPIIARANYYMYVVTDAENVVTEYDENNNSKRSDAIIQIGVPDLAVTAVAIPSAVNAGQKLKVNWKITNIGSSLIENASWTDRIYLSPNDTYTPNNAIWFDVKFAAQTLDASTSINREISLNIPDIVSGRYYAYVYTDFTNTVYEDTSEYNNISRSYNYADITTGLPVNDIGISEIITPKSDCGLTANETIKVKISNYGNLFHSGFNVSYKLNNGTAVTENVGAASLLPGSTLTYTFTTKANLSTIADYTLKAYTTLLNDTLISNDTITGIIRHYPVLSAPLNLLPIDGSANLNKPINFSWGAVANATSYDLYIWKATDVMPSTPTIKSLSQINYSYSSNLVYGTSYKWMVIAKSTNCQTSSIIQTFTVRNLPDLITESIIVPTNGGTSETPFSVSWKIKNIGLGSTNQVKWYESVYLTLSATNRANDSLIGVYENVSALDVNQSYTTPLLTFVLPKGAQGRYYIVVKTNVYNSLEEVTDANNIQVIPIDVTLLPPPDLQITNLVVSPTTLFSEDTLNIGWTVKNVGTGSTTASSWVDYVYLSKSRTLNTATATRLGIYTRNGALAVNEQYTKTEKVKLPKNIGGGYFIHFITDATDKVFEYVYEHNNTAIWDSIDVIMRPVPNLTINSVAAPNDTASNHQNLTLQWTTKNEGAATANPSWSDNIRLTSDTANGYTNYYNLANYYQNNSIQSLSAIGSQQTVQVPYNLPEGKYFFYAISDIYNQIFEGDNETDNISPYSPPIYIVNPDLKPALLQAPTSAKSEETVTLSWTVGNVGIGAVHNSSWYDAIYLSNDTIYDNADLQLNSASNSQLLSSGSQYNKQQTVTLPRGISGTYYFIFVSDAGNQVFEKNESNNRLYVPINISIAPWPDLQVSTIQVPGTDTAGTNITINYSVKNFGVGKIDNKSWSDVFYLSSTADINDPSKIYLGSASNQRSLNAGESYSNTMTAQLPTYISGNYYLIVMADGNNAIYEYSAEDNNKKVSDTYVAISQLPNVDLAAISGKVVADSLTSGQTVSVEWNGINTGTTPTIITDWEDAIYLSNNPTLDATDRLLTTVKINKSLQPSVSYNQKSTITIPNDASGILYFLVNVDKTNQQNDVNRGNNTKVLDIILKNTGQIVDSSGRVVIVQPLPSDLVPISFDPNANGSAGQPLPVSYSVKNNGTGSTNSNQWTDRIYLSTDYNLDGGDILIGSFTHNGKLAPKTQYVENQQATIPYNVSGNYIVIFKTDAFDNVFESNGENNNLAFGNILIQQQQLCDLIVSQVIPPTATQIAGQSIVINYTVKNTGVNQASGYFKDAVYISTDSIWDANDILLGTTDLRTAFLPPQSSINKQFTGSLINVAAGNYYVIVKTDILNNLLEVDENNNSTSSVATLQVGVKQLTMNIPALDTLANNQLLYYRIDILPSQKGETMSLTLAADSTKNAVNRYYIRYGQAPAANAYDFNSEIPFSANQEVIVPELKEGTYYILASGNIPAANYQPVTLLARIIPFAITKVDATKGGNTGAVTVRINGAKFDSATTFSLSGGGGSISPVKIYYINSTQVFATFNLLNATLGTYDVVATKSNNVTTKLINGFEIEKGVGSTAGNGNGAGSGTGFVCQVVNIGFEDHLETNYAYPPSTRPLKLVGITIFFANRGNVDIPAPTRFLTALKSNMPLSFLPDSIPTTANTNNSTSSTTLSSLNLDFTETNGPSPGILRPGASGYIKVYTIAYQTSIGSLDLFLTK